MFVTTAPKDTRLTPLSEVERDAIELIKGWLVKFREATANMSTTKSVTLSSVQAIFCDLQDHIRDAYRSLPRTVPASLKQGLLNAHRKLSDYYYITDSSPYYIWAARVSRLFQLFLLLARKLT